MTYLLFKGFNNQNTIVKFQLRKGRFYLKNEQLVKPDYRVFLKFNE